MLTLLPNRLLVEIEATPLMFHGIALPDITERKTHTGRIKGMGKMTRRAIRTMGIAPGDLRNARVLMKPVGGTHVGGNDWLYPAIQSVGHKKYESVVLAVLPEKAEVKSKGGVPRCRYCGDAKSGAGQGMIMTYKQLVPWDSTRTLVCGRCGRDTDGRKHDLSV